MSSQSTDERLQVLARFIRNQVSLADRPPPGCIQLNNDEALLCAEALENVGHLERERDEWSSIAAQRLRETQLARADYDEQVERRRQAEHERDFAAERLALLDRQYQRVRRYLVSGDAPEVIYASTPEELYGVAPDVPAPQAGGCIHCGDDEH